MSMYVYIYVYDIHQVVNEDGETLQKAKIGVDRDTTTFEKLTNRLTKTLKLEP